MVGSSNSIIRGNRITANVKSAIFVQGLSGPTNGRNNLIEGNFLFQTGGSDSDAIQGHSNDSGTDINGLRIINNYIEMGSGDFGIEVGAFGGNAPTDVIIEDNLIKGTAAWFGGISLDDVSRSQITGNVVDSNGSDFSIGGIELVGVSASTISGNVVIGTAGGASGILMDGNGGTDDNTIANNVIDGFANTASKGGISLEASGGATTIKRNVITGNVVRFIAATNAGVSYRGIQIFGNTATSDVTDNDINHNIILGNGDTAIEGLTVVNNSGGTVDRNIFQSNTIIDVANGVFRDANQTNTTFLDNRFQGVTTEFAGTKVATEIRRNITVGSAADTITSGTTQTQVGATALTASFNDVDTHGNTDDGVKLPTAVAGAEVQIWNDTATANLRVWPATGDAIEAASVDAVGVVKVEPDIVVTYRAVDAKTWYITDSYDRSP